LVLEAGPRFEPARDFPLDRPQWEQTGFPERPGSQWRHTYGSAQKLDPAWDLLGYIFIDQKKFPEAADALGKELELVTEPGRRAGLLLNRALAFREQDKTVEALPLLEEAHQLAPSDANVIVQLAEVYVALGRSEDAEQVIGADLPPAEAAVLNFNIAANFFKAKKWQQAADHFAKCTELDPKMAEAHRYRGEALISLDRQQEAIAAFEAYLAAAPNATDAATTRQIIDSLKKDIKVREQQQQQQQAPKKKK